MAAPLQHALGVLQPNVHQATGEVGTPAFAMALAADRRFRGCVTSMLARTGARPFEIVRGVYCRSPQYRCLNQHCGFPYHSMMS